MKKKCTVFLLLFAIFVFSGCQSGKEGDSVSTQNTSKDSEKTEDREKGKHGGATDLEGLWRDGEYTLRETVLLPESRLLLCYGNGNNYRFKIYDLTEQKITNESEVLSPAEELSGGLEKMRILPEYFYVLSGTDCYIYDDSCRLVQQIDISDRMNSLEYSFSVPYWIADDLSKAAYIKRGENGIESLYVGNLDGSGEELIYSMDIEKSESQGETEGRLVGIEEVYWASGKDCLGFSGNVIPKGKNESVECYGYIVLENKKMEIILEDDTWVSCRGNTMLIADDTGAYGSASKGKVRFLNLDTKEKKEISTKFSDECKQVGLGTGSECFVGMHQEEKTQSVVFTVYKDGKAFASAEYLCSNEQQYTDFTVSSNSLAVDADTGQIFLFYYDTPSVSYAVKAFPYESF